jgi:hypothetical protein
LERLLPNALLHPLDERYINAYTLHSALHSEADSGAQTPISPPACPLCLGELVANPRRRAGFVNYRHKSGAHAEHCPLTTARYQPDDLMIRGPRDPLSARRQRSRFLYRWKRHYRIARSAAPSLSIRRFTELIEYADVLNLWSYPRLAQRDLPYALLVLAGFVAARNERDELVWVRFWFDKSVSDMGDLWQEGAHPPRLFKVIYRKPLHTPFPTGAEILFWEPVVRAARRADAETSAVSRAEIRAFARYMEHSASVRSEQYEEANEHAA